MKHEPRSFGHHTCKRCGAKPPFKTRRCPRSVISPESEGRWMRNILKGGLRGATAGRVTGQRLAWRP